MSKPWWDGHPAIEALKQRALAEVGCSADADDDPDEPDDYWEEEYEQDTTPDPVVQEFYSGACVVALRAARDGLAAARTSYDEAVLKARTAGLSWAEIGMLLGVSRQALHHRFRDREGPPPPGL